MNEAFSHLCLGFPSVLAGRVQQVVTSEMQQSAVDDVAPPCAASADCTRHGAQPCLLRPSVTGLACN
jgi:hypothetical protein